MHRGGAGDAHSTSPDGPHGEAGFRLDRLYQGAGHDIVRRKVIGRQEAPRQIPGPRTARAEALDGCPQRLRRPPGLGSTGARARPSATMGAFRPTPRVARPRLSDQHRAQPRRQYPSSHSPATNIRRLRQHECGARPRALQTNPLLVNSEAAGHAGYPGHVAFPPVRAIRDGRRRLQDASAGMDAELADRRADGQALLLQCLTGPRGRRGYSGRKRQSSAQRCGDPLLPLFRGCGGLWWSAHDSMAPDGMRALVPRVERPGVVDDRQSERGILVDASGQCPAFALIEPSGSTVALRRP